MTTSYSVSSWEQPRIVNWRNVALRSLLILATTSLLMLDDWVQQWFTPANQADFELNYALALVAFNLGLWLCGSRVFVAFVLAGLAGMELIQLGHISYAGRPLDPIVLGSLFSDFEDVRQVALSDFGDHWHVLPAVLLPYAAAMTLFAVYMKSDVKRWQRMLGLALVAVALLSKPYRATYRDINSFMPGPTRSALHNSLNTFAFFLVNGTGAAAAELQALPTLPAPTITPFASGAQHVWLVVSDSLRAGHMGVLGYPRETTPRLRARMEQGLIARQGVAAAVSTAASMPLILNTVREPGQLAQIRGLSTNLFRLAKASGYKTYWISSQESKLLNDVGSRYIDVSITREDEPARFMREGDDAVLQLLKEQKWPEKTFVVVLLRTAHAPYEANYEHDRASFAKWPDDRSLPREERMGNAYDNSVLYLDSLLDGMIDEFDTLKGERHLVVTGDHGQLLGRKGMWGHNVLEPDVADVPVLAWNREAPESSYKDLLDARWISHFEMSRWVAQALGHRIDSPAYVEGVHYLQGKNLYGANTFREVHEGTVLEYSEVLSVGHQLPVRPTAEVRSLVVR